VTEQEWMACEDRQPMLEHFRGKFTDRKLRLFACACCRQVWSLLPGDGRAAVEVAERFADGKAGQTELGLAQNKAIDAARSAEGEAVWHATDADSFSAAFVTSFCAAGQEHVLGWPGRNDNNDEQVVKDHARFAGLLRDIVGNPFRPIAFNPRWRTADTVGLATGIYEDRAFDRLGLLADALQDAGCDDDQVLGHCRSDGPHVRGCFVVDLVLGKE
jgi:hypothetical protein